MENTAFQIELAWDPRKAETNRTKHGVDFVIAAEVLQDPMALSVLDQEHGRDEERWFTLGAPTKGQLFAVSHTWEEQSGIVYVRIISARKATRKDISTKANPYKIIMKMTNPNDDIPAEIDFAAGQRGRFYRPNEQWQIPVYLNPEVQQYFLRRAEENGMDFDQIINTLLQKDIELLETVEPRS